MCWMKKSWIKRQQTNKHVNIFLFLVVSGGWWCADVVLSKRVHQNWWWGSFQASAVFFLSPHLQWDKLLGKARNCAEKGDSWWHAHYWVKFGCHSTHQIISRFVCVTVMISPVMIFEQSVKIKNCATTVLHPFVTKIPCQNTENWISTTQSWFFCVCVVAAMVSISSFIWYQCCFQAADLRKSR